MNLKIKNFPHAQLDQNTFRGFLCHYYVVGSIDINLWRASYSPEILNFKEGGNNSIEFFVPPFAELIKFVMNQTNLNSGILIPVPSSTSKNDSFFSAVPYDKIKMSKRKNRDNRSEIFCEKVIEYSALDLQSVELLVRQTTKLEKKNRTISDQLKSLIFDMVKFQNIVNSESKIYILIDDVETTGNTLSACSQILKSNIGDAKIVCLSIAKSRSHLEYQPLSEIS